MCLIIPSIFRDLWTNRPVQGFHHKVVEMDQPQLWWILSFIRDFFSTLLDIPLTSDQKASKKTLSLIARSILGETMRLFIQSLIKSLLFDRMSGQTPSMRSISFLILGVRPTVLSKVGFFGSRPSYLTNQKHSWTTYICTPLFLTKMTLDRGRRHVKLSTTTKKTAKKKKFVKVLFFFSPERDENRLFFSCHCFTYDSFKPTRFVFLSPVMSDDQPRVVNGRGRPRKGTVAASHSEKKSNTLVEDTFPPELFDVQYTGMLSVDPQAIPALQGLVDAAELKLEQTLQGVRAFGFDVILPSYQPPKKMLYAIPATIPTLFLFHTLFQQQVCSTAEGKISIFPFRVFASGRDRLQGTNGYPVVAVHIPHLKAILWRLYSASREFKISNDTLNKDVDWYGSFLSRADDKVLAGWTGIDIHANKLNGEKRSYVLIPAVLLDVMKNFFVNARNLNQLRDIGEVLRGVYRDLPDFRDKFHDSFRILWAGRERTVSVSEIIKLAQPEVNHTFSMVRVRHVKVDVVESNGSRRPWRPRWYAAADQIRFEHHCIVYGVQCWREQVVAYHTARCFFHSSDLELLNQEPQHTISLLHALYDPLKKVSILSRDEALARGIHDDGDKNGSRNSNHYAVLSKLKGKLGDYEVEHFFHSRVKVTPEMLKKAHEMAQD